MSPRKNSRSAPLQCSLARHKRRRALHRELFMVLVPCAASAHGIVGQIMRQSDKSYNKFRDGKVAKIRRRLRSGNSDVRTYGGDSGVEIPTSEHAAAITEWKFRRQNVRRRLRSGNSDVRNVRRRLRSENSDVRTCGDDYGVEIPTSGTYDDDYGAVIPTSGTYGGDSGVVIPTFI